MLPALTGFCQPSHLHYHLQAPSGLYRPSQPHFFGRQGPARPAEADGNAAGPCRPSPAYVGPASLTTSFWPLPALTGLYRPSQPHYPLPAPAGPHRPLLAQPASLHPSGPCRPHRPLPAQPASLPPSSPCRPSQPHYLLPAPAGLLVAMVTLPAPAGLAGSCQPLPAKEVPWIELPKQGLCVV